MPSWDAAHCTASQGLAKLSGQCTCGLLDDAFFDQIMNVWHC